MIHKKIRQRESTEGFGKSQISLVCTKENNIWFERHFLRSIDTQQRRLSKKTNKANTLKVIKLIRKKDN